MSKFIVRGGTPLDGEVRITGAKNSVLPIMAASILSEGKCIIKNVPFLRDVMFMRDIIEDIGFSVDLEDEDVLVIKSSEIKSSEPSFELAKKMRASILVLAPLLAKTGFAKISLPGGCAIGERPIELHLKGFRALGAKITKDTDGVTAEADKLKGADIYLDFPSVGATESIMMAASLAEGVTHIENAAQEPEIVDLANYLNKMGARVKGAGTDTIKIQGVDSLKGAQHTVIPDRIEAGTFMVAAAITRGRVHVTNILTDHMKPIIAKLIEMGISVYPTDEGVLVDAVNKDIIATDIKTLPYPGFPTDMQSPFMTLLTTVNGSSKVIETVFENRFMHVGELNKMGANMRIDGKTVFIPGGASLNGAKVIATDLRAGAAVVLAGLSASGSTEVLEIYHIDRGYYNFISKLKTLGADIQRVSKS